MPSLLLQVVAGDDAAVTVSWADVGELVKQRRQALRLSLRDVAPIAAVSVSTWHGLENGKRIAEQSRVKIAQALRWPDDAIDRLLDGADPADFEEQDEPSNWEAELVQTIRGLTEVVRELRAEVKMARELAARDRVPPPSSS